MLKPIFEQISQLDVANLTAEEIELIIPEYGMNGENLNEMPGELSQYYGKGIKFWQYPNQFSKFIKYIHGKPINSYLEIGCRWGGTFVIVNEILKQTNPNVDSYACDIIEMQQTLQEYSDYSKFTYLQGNSFSPDTFEKLPKQIDFVFIDGDHSYEGVTRDFETALKLNPKYVMFHDIANQVCPGVVTFWDEIKSKYPHHEFVEQYDSVNGNFLGIGVIEL